MNPIIGQRFRGLESLSCFVYQDGAFFAGPEAAGPGDSSQRRMDGFVCSAGGSPHASGARA